MGNAGVAPTNGPLAGVRLDLLFGGAIDVSFNISYAALERLVIDPSLSPAERKLGIAVYGQLVPNLLWIAEKSFKSA